MHKTVNNEQGFSLVEALVILVVVVLLCVIGGLVYKRQHAPQVSSSPRGNSQVAPPLTISRSNPLKQPNVTEFTVKVQKIQTANTIMADILHLQILPSSSSGSVITNCPLDDGVMYTLKFTNPIVTVGVNASGCQQVSLSNSKSTYTANTTDSSGKTFWNDLKKATGQPINSDPLLSN